MKLDDYLKSPVRTNLLSLDNKGLEELSADIRNEIIKCVSHNGGHLSSNLGIVEVTVSLFKNFDFTQDKIIFDVGHQSYTYKILTGRRLETLRQKGGVSPFQSRKESSFDHYDAGHSSTSISAALGFAMARAKKGEKYDIIVVIGELALSNGLALEALLDLSKRNEKIIIIFNDNKPENSIKYKNIFTSLNLDYIGPYDGHSFSSLDEAIKEGKNSEKTVAVHVITKKGKGYKFAEDNEEIYHGVPPFDPEIGLTMNREVSWSKYYADEVYQMMEKDDKIYLIVPATEVGSELNEISHTYPDRTIDVGIKEEHAVTLSGALAIEGLKPIVSIYSTFLQRAYDEVSHDVARMNAQVTFLVDRAGIVGEDGETHQGIYDVAYLSTIPNVQIAMAMNITQVESLLNYHNPNGPFFIRVPKENIRSFLSITPQKSIIFHKWQLFKEAISKEIAIIGVGPLFEEVIFRLKDQDVTLINALFLNPIDKELIQETELSQYKTIIVYNPYAIHDAFATEIATQLALSNYQGKFYSLSIPKEFIQFASKEETLSDLKLLPEHVETLVKLILDGHKF